MWRILKWFFFFGLIFSLFDMEESAATLEQMNSAARMMRDICQPKFKISDEVADGIKNGNIPDDKAVKCYINCILEMSQLVKKGKVQQETANKQIDIMLPEELRDEYKNGLEQCKDSGKGIKNPCDASFELLKCFHGTTPNFIFP